MTADPPLFLRLDEADFRRLVAGGVVTLRGSDGREARLILADIGYGRMYAAIAEAVWTPRDDD